MNGQRTNTVTGQAVGLPPPLARAINRVAPVSACDAGEAASTLRDALGPIGASTWPEVAWRSSPLTGTGYPVELAWASRDAALRWTSEVAGPEVPTHERLPLCGSAAASLTGMALAVSAWTAIQRERSLSWGAWLCLRLLGGERRAKVYVELPPHSRLPQPWAKTSDRLAGAVPGLLWRMAGCNEDGSLELYARVPQPRSALLPTLAGLVGDDGAMERVVGAMLGPRQPSGGSGLPSPSGLSITMSVDATPLAVTWFSFAKALWSSDARATAALTRLCEEAVVRAAPGSLPLYAALAAGPDDGRWRHGMVGVGVDRTGTTWVQAGLRPT